MYIKTTTMDIRTQRITKTTYLRVVGHKNSSERELNTSGTSVTCVPGNRLGYGWVSTNIYCDVTLTASTIT